MKDGKKFAGLRPAEKALRRVVFVTPARAREEAARVRQLAVVPHTAGEKEEDSSS